MDHLKDIVEKEFCIPYLIHSTSLYSKIAILQLFKVNGCDITPEQFGILRILSLQDGLYQRQMSQLLLKDRPNVTRLLDILEKKEFVYREVDPHNRRIFKVHITDKGRTQITEILPLLKEIRSKVYDILEEEEKETLRRILTKLRNTLEENFPLQI